jgi:flagellar motor switch protein FliN/FliY
MITLETSDNARIVLDQWAESLADVLASMADQRPEVRWTAGAGPLAAEPESLWWEQPFQGCPEMTVWIAAPRLLWEHAGAITLKAAGLENAEQSEARNTWLEILGQSLGGMARSIGSILRREVVCDAGVERAPAEIGGWASVAFGFTESDLPPLTVAFGPGLLNLLSNPAESAAERPGSDDSARPGAPVSPTASRTMDLLLDIDLPVSISFGKTQLPLKDVLKLTTGSIVELNRGVNDQVEVLVNQHLIARGEVVVVEGNYGVRIQQIAHCGDRLRGLR